MFLEMNIQSKELKRNTQINVLLPHDAGDTDAPYKTLWLLHGLMGDHSSWMRNTSIERYAHRHKLIVIMPNIDRGWYTNTVYGANYFSFIADELPALCRRTFHGMSDKREDNIVAGLSMGGYGALKLALTRPDQYSGCISLSGSLDITRKGRPYDLNEWRSIFGYDLKSALELAGSRHDLFALAEQNQKEGRPFPKLYLWCGTEDTLIHINRDFDQHLSTLNVPHAYRESEGNHTWRWWDLHIQDALKNILET